MLLEIARKAYTKLDENMIICDRGDAYVAEYSFLPAVPVAAACLVQNYCGLRRQRRGMCLVINAPINVSKQTLVTK